jgi:hypothetical protein
MNPISEETEEEGMERVHGFMKEMSKAKDESIFYRSNKKWSTEIYRVDPDGQVEQVVE